MTKLFFTVVECAEPTRNVVDSVDILDRFDGLWPHAQNKFHGTIVCRPV